LPRPAADAVLRLASKRETPLDRYWVDPGLVLADAGMPPDPWQRKVLSWTGRQLLLLCARQTGKSSVTGALAVKTALLEPPALILLLSPTLRQSGELFRDKFLRVYDAIGRPVKAVRQSALSLELANGSRVVSLPENEAGIRGFSGVSLIVIDEASRVGDDLYYAVRPMLAVSGGKLVALSTPFGKRGWFFEEWQGKSDWERVRVTAEMCPRITKEFLRQERASLGERWYRQEWMCSFEDSVDAVFSNDDIQAAMSHAVEPLF
jgi:hypothetical protein